MATVEQPAGGAARYVAPTSLEEATQALAVGEATLFAGGTDVMVGVNARQQTLAPTLMNLRYLPELRGISLEDGEIRIGATVTITEVLESDLLAQEAPVLVQTADRFASSQIRNAATVGGNICNASPAGDLILPLLVLDAEVELAEWAAGTIARRRAPLAEVFTGPGATVIRPTEILTAVWFPKPPEGFVATFEKSGPRPALEIAIVAAAVGGVRTETGLDGARVALGSVAPTPIQAPQTEAAIADRKLDVEGRAAVAEIAATEIAPIDDVRGSAWYRRHLTRAMIERALERVVAV
jgi:CO/xanthine dehydrogenase FAD-binding subunit